MDEQIRDLDDSATFLVDRPQRDAPPREEKRRSPGDCLGRYVVVDEVGAGAMGVVYRAYDPKLQREVALKCVRSGALKATQTARLVREAQAMAQLDYPHVVSVFDVEVLEDDVVLVMEYVEGETLRDWCAETERRWEAIVSMFVQAGRGLAAAHDVGLLHRDFKPSNVLVSRDGRARVTDFGLARIDESAPHSSEGLGSLAGPLSSSSDGGQSFGASISGGSVDALLTSRLTRVAGVVGTPRYMAPEQHDAKAALDARADQYAFCVALWEALTGTLPFTVERHNWRSVAAAKRKEPPPWPGGTRIPARMAAAIRRGLSPDPEDRWRSMHGLLAALDVRRRRRRPWALVAVGAVVLGSTAGVLAATAEVDDSCISRSDVRGGWHGDARAAVLARFERLEPAFAEDVGAAIVERLDAYDESWNRARRDACEAHHVRQEQSQTVYDLRSRCLQDAADTLRVAADRLIEVESADAARAHRVLRVLPELARCDDLTRLNGDRGRPEVSREARRHLREAQVAMSLGDPGEASEALQELGSLDDPRIDAPAEFLRGRIAVESLRYEEAATSLRDVVRRASESEQWPLAWQASGALADLYGVRLRLEEQGRAHAKAAMMLGQRPGFDGLHRARWNMTAGDIALTHARWVEAASEFRSALVILDDIEPSELESRTRAHVGLAKALRGQGKFDAAREELRKGLDRVSDELGSVHPLKGEISIELGELEFEAGRFEEAERRAVEGRALIEAAVGPHHPWTLDARIRCGALALQRSSATVPELEALEQALARLQAVRPAKAGDRRVEVASALHAIERFEEARSQVQQAIDEYERLYGPRDPRIGVGSLRLGRVLEELGDLAGARQAYERAWSIVETSEGPHRAATAFALAQLLRVQGENHRRAEALARAALSAATEREDATLADQIRRWLAASSE